MDYKKSALKVLDMIGGSGNIISATHCATRLRLVIGDNEKCDKDALENIEGVKGVFVAAGQLQIIFGAGEVNRVYDEFISAAGIAEVSRREEESTFSGKGNSFLRMINRLSAK